LETARRLDAVMNEQRRFLRGFLIATSLVVVLFGAEFLWEWNSLGRPGLSDMSWAGSDNRKLVDVLSPFARAYNNILGMLLATIGLAIPLTANMHTPKLIEMFLRDRINQVVLGFCTLGAAHVLWVDSLIGPNFAPIWAYRLAIYGALLGWAVLIPYFFYVVRFLDPTNILRRLRDRVDGLVEAARAGRLAMRSGRAQVRERMYQISTIIMKAVERGDRGVVVEGTRELQEVLEHYVRCKPGMPAEWFRVTRDDCIGLSDEAIELIVEERSWFEHRILALMFTAYQSVLSRMSDLISSFSDTVRHIALYAARHDDDAMLDLTVKFFNNFLPEAIKRKDVHAVYDVFYQYRLLASELCDRPALLRKIGRYFRIYCDVAAEGGLTFVPMFVAFDLGWLVATAYEKRSQAAPELLEEMLALDHQAHGDRRWLIVKAKIILGAKLAEDGFAAAAERLREDLADVSAPTLAAIEEDLLVRAERSFWEVTDRQVTFDWVPPRQREGVKNFLDSLSNSRTTTPRAADRQESMVDGPSG
jgi:hypothetical protein